MIRTILICTFLVAGLVKLQAQSAYPELQKYLCHKWRVIWFSDNGNEQNMEAKKQQLHLREDGSGTMFMLGEVVGPVTWETTGKKTIKFSDDPSVPAYTVKVKTYKDAQHMLFTGVMPNGVTRKVYFEILSGKP